MTIPQRRWTVLISRQAEKVLDRLPQELVRRLDRAILALGQDPRPPGCKKLAGYTNLYRLRVGDWRISYAIEADELVILIVEVAPRGQACRI